MNELSSRPNSSAIVLTDAQFQGLANMPAELEWFASIESAHTRRAYQSDIRGFMAFAGMLQAEDFRLVTRAHVLRGHNDEIKSLSFSPDGTKLASAGCDRVVHIWDVRDGKLLAGPNPKGRHAIALSPGNPLRLASSP